MKKLLGKVGETVLRAYYVNAAFVVKGPWDRYDDISYDAFIEALERHVNHLKACREKNKANNDWRVDFSLECDLGEVRKISKGLLKEMIRDLENQLMKADGETVPVPKH